MNNKPNCEWACGVIYVDDYHGIIQRVVFMISKPAIPVLALLLEDAHTDYKTLFSIATAYAHSGLLVSEHAKKNDRLEFTFPACCLKIDGIS